MPKEIETKFKISCQDTFRKALKKIGAKFLSKEFEQDVYYRAPAAQCSAGTVRLRAMGRKGLFTIKGSAGMPASRTYKIREELEVSVDDVKLFGEMLAKLGFLPRFRKEKIRETYKCKDAKILIDEIPFIGFYAEIEAPKGRIKELARSLGLDMSKAIPDTYMELFGYYKMLHKKPKLELIFNRRSHV